MKITDLRESVIFVSTPQDFKSEKAYKTLILLWITNSCNNSKMHFNRQSIIYTYKKTQFILKRVTISGFLIIFEAHLTMMLKL